MRNLESKQKWINSGYEMFAREGAEGIHIEILARELGLNKSGFYHHFGDREIFISELLEYHRSVNKEFAEGISQCKNFDPDFIRLLIKFRTAVLFQMQLRRQVDSPVFQEEFYKLSTLNIKYIAPIWAEYIKIANDQKLAILLFQIFRDTFFLRINQELLTYEYVRTISSEFAYIVSILLNYAGKTNTLKLTKP